jgi:hypothetical protein
MIDFIVLELLRELSHTYIWLDNTISKKDLRHVKLSSKIRNTCYIIRGSAFQGITTCLDAKDDSEHSLILINCIFIAT